MRHFFVFGIPIKPQPSKEFTLVLVARKVGILSMSGQSIVAIAKLIFVLKTKKRVELCGVC